MKILIVGETGSGKSSSIKTLNPSETFILAVTKRVLPFKGWRRGYKSFNTKTGQGNHINGISNHTSIMAMMDFISSKRKDIKTLIIDDQHI